jgi:hypothetical protein
MNKKKILTCIVVISALHFCMGCASSNSPVKRLARDTDKAAGEIVKVREIKRDGETRAIVSPADGQFKIPF